MKIAYGKLKILPEDFKRFSWRDFYLMLEGHNQAHKDEILRPLRIVAYNVYATNFRGTKKSPKPIERFWPLEDTAENFNINEMAAAFEQAAKAHKKPEAETP